MSLTSDNKNVTLTHKGCENVNQVTYQSFKTRKTKENNIEALFIKKKSSV